MSVRARYIILTVLTLLTAVCFSVGLTLTLAYDMKTTGIVNSTFIAGNRGWIVVLPNPCNFAVGPTTTNYTVINEFLQKTYPIGQMVYYDGDIGYCGGLTTYDVIYKGIITGVCLLSCSLLSFIMFLLVLTGKCFKCSTSVGIMPHYEMTENIHSETENRKDHRYSSLPQPPPYSEE